MSVPNQLKLSMVNRPYPGQATSGDWPFFYARGDDLLLGLVDSLGHGAPAHAFSMQIRGFLDAHWHAELPRLIDELHVAVRGGLGAAICLAHVTLGLGVLRCVGIGNVHASALGSINRRFVSRDGVLGLHYRTPMVQEARLARGDKIIVASDGMQERLFRQCGLTEASRSPDSLVQHLLCHYGKSHDDASCLVFEF